LRALSLGKLPVGGRAELPVTWKVGVRVRRSSDGAEQLDGPVVDGSVEEPSEYPVATVLVRGGQGEQGHRRAQLECVDGSEEREGVTPVIVEDDVGGATEPGAQHRVVEVGQASSTDASPKYVSRGLEPRPRNWVKTNHIQCEHVAPTASSPTARS